MAQLILYENAYFRLEDFVQNAKYFILIGAGAVRNEICLAQKSSS